MLELVRCPVCRAGLEGGAPVEEPCRRCAADLGLLRRVYGEARRLRMLAREALAAGRGGRAAALARRAVGLVDEPETRATLCAALIAAGRVEAAWAILAEGPDPRPADSRKYWPSAGHPSP